MIFSCESQNQLPKYNGISLVASRNSIDNKHVDPLLATNANAVAVMPFAFMESLDSPNLRFNLERQWWGEQLEGSRETIKLLQSQNLKVLLKPQIWIRNGEFTGEIYMKSEEDWVNFEQNYTEFILLFAKLAEEENVEVFSIGTELFSFTNQRPAYWLKLIEEVEKIYKGKLTYAENWDKVEQVDFWSSLDYVGVDAYFPLSDKKAPTIKELKKGWEPHKLMLKNLSKTTNKPILFTEFGYRNVDFTAKEPWDSSRDLNAVNDKAQSDALQAIFEEFWNEKWFAGGFLWKWHPEYLSPGEKENLQFTPQHKLAESLITKFYGNNLN